MDSKSLFCSWVVWIPRQWLKITPTVTHSRKRKPLHSLALTSWNWNFITLFVALLHQGRASQVLSGCSHMSQSPCFLARRKSILLCVLKPWPCNAFTPQQSLSLRRKDPTWFIEWNGLAAFCISGAGAPLWYWRIRLLKCSQHAYLDLFDPTYVSSCMILLYLVYSSLQCGKVSSSAREEPRWSRTELQVHLFWKQWPCHFRDTI